MDKALNDLMGNPLAQLAPISAVHDKGAILAHLTQQLAASQPKTLQEFRDKKIADEFAEAVSIVVDDLMEVGKGKYDPTRADNLEEALCTFTEKDSRLYYKVLALHVRNLADRPASTGVGVYLLSISQAYWEEIATHVAKEQVADQFEADEDRRRQRDNAEAKADYQRGCAEDRGPSNYQFGRMANESFGGRS